ncbi:hypothetical protein TRVA0_007S02564 [Trichomonascus vanleenenianus]|uniref:tyrosyl-DNA phosphodiesterase 1 n=1 Tax=Trichomonascus vanleenenianus TaxID=2268995 RepID=UPI003ECAB680
MKRDRGDDDDDSGDVKKPRVEQGGEEVRSPIRLIRVRDLPDSMNQDAVSLADIIGHVDLVEMYQFNFAISIEFVMSQIHPDALGSVKSWFFYGYTPDHDPRTERLMNEASACQYPENITLQKVRLSNRFATHHSKVMVLKFADGSIQIVIHTANMISFDWTNMSQGAWLSERLMPKKDPEDTSTPVGAQFQQDFIRYLRAYRKEPSNKLAEELKGYDFSPVHAKLIASVPGNYIEGQADYGQWGIVRLRNEIEQLGLGFRAQDEIIAQVSSIAQFGANDTYLGPTIHAALNGLPFNQPQNVGDFFGGHHKKEKVPLSIVFPTVEQVKQSINGYGSGCALHFKRQTDAQKKQLAYMQARLHRYVAQKAGRQPAAPHIKTYARISHRQNDEEAETERLESGGIELEWFLLTSANLSKHAWGIIPKGKQSEWIQSWECGVLITKDCYGDYPGKGATTSDGEPLSRGHTVSLKPIYRADAPASSIQPTRSGTVISSGITTTTKTTKTATDTTSGISTDTGTDKPGREKSEGPDNGGSVDGMKSRTVYIRMPYDLPLKRYTPKDVPWSAYEQYSEPDWRGDTWPPE